MYSVRLITGIGEFRGLEKEWDDLARRFANPLLEYDWYCTCAEILHSDDLLRIVLVYREKILVAAAPLVLVRRGVTRWLEILGSSMLHEPAGLLYQGEADLRQLLHAVCRLGYPVNLARLEAEIPPGSSLSSGLSKHGVLLRRTTAASCFLKTDDTREAFQAAMGKKWRAEFRNKRHRAARQGSVEFSIGCPGADQLKMLLQQAVDVEAASWKGRQGTSLNDNDRLREFFFRYAQRAQAKGTLCLCFMYLQGQAIAMHIGAELHNSIWFFKTGYDDRWARLSPGMQLSNETVLYALGKRLKSYDFLGSAEKWQHAWPVRFRRYCTILILPYSFRGLLGAFGVLKTVFSRRLRSGSNVSEPASVRH